MENFLVREIGGSTSESLIRESESKFSSQKEVNTSAKTKETPSKEKTAPGSSVASMFETPSTSTLKQVTKGRKLFLHVYFLNGNLLLPHGIRISNQYV